jgi:ATP synthase protein I
MAIERLTGSGRWDDAGSDDKEWGKPAAKPLTAQEASALRARHPSVAPLRVLVVQASMGLCLTLLALRFAEGREVAWSAAYGCATVVVPGMLMARGVSARRGRMSPGLSAVSVVSWSVVKIGVSIAMLVLAPKLIQPVSWPALLATMVLCMQVYWLALLWRGR